MYTQFYKLNDLPFRLTPDPKYLFRTESIVEALANLEYGIESGKGIIVLTGEAGTGKTTTLRTKLTSADHRVMAAYIFNPLLSTGEFFDTVLAEFNISPQPSKPAMLRALGHLLLSRHLDGLRTVLVIDEAHLLPPYLLEEIRLLSNFETNREKLLQTVLCGQPELMDVLEQPELRQLKQRVALRCRIEHLSASQTGQYIRSRLRVAGCKNDSLFEPETIGLIHAASMGIPRTINNICDSALLMGFAASSPSINTEAVSEAIDLLGLAPARTQSDHLARAASSTPLRAAVAASGAFANHGENVHYLRPKDGASAGIRFEDSPPARDNVRFIIEFDGPNAAAAPGQFFSKMRVSRQ